MFTEGTENTDVAMVLKIKYLPISLSMVKSNIQVIPRLSCSPFFPSQSPTCSSLPISLLMEGLGSLKTVLLVQIIFFWISQHIKKHFISSLSLSHTHIYTYKLCFFYNIYPHVNCFYPWSLLHYDILKLWFISFQETRDTYDTYTHWPSILNHFVPWKTEFKIQLYVVSPACKST